MASNPTRTSNIRTAGWLMLVAFIIGLLALVIATIWELQSSLTAFSEFFDSLDASAIFTGVLFPGNLIALIATFGIALSPEPARRIRGVIYAALGAAIEFVVLLLSAMNNQDGFDPSLPFLLHLIVAFALVLVLPRKEPRATRSLLRRSAIVTGAATIVMILVAVLTFPFLQYGTATSTTEAANVHQIRLLSNRLLAAGDAELNVTKAAKLKAISENQASMVGTANFDCGFNTTPVHFDGSFDEKAKLKAPAPQLVLKEGIDPNVPPTAPSTPASGTTGTSTQPQDDRYTAASVKAAKVYWSQMKDRIVTQIGATPEGWKVKAASGDSDVLISIASERRSDAIGFSGVTLSLRAHDDNRASAFFSANLAGCYPLNEAPNGTH